MTPPIIVCGYPRSGTSFVETLLSQHQDISISSEFPLQRLMGALLVVHQIRKLHAAPHEEWRGLSEQEAGAAAMRAVWFYNNAAGMAARRYGNKTAGNERFIPIYERVFRATPPLYVYAMRDCRDVIASFKRVPWGQDVAVPRIHRGIKKSVARIERFQQKHPHRVHILQLDRATIKADQHSLVDALFSFVGEEPDDGVRHYRDKWPRENASPHDGGDNQKWPITSELRGILTRYGYN